MSEENKDEWAPTEEQMQRARLAIDRRDRWGLVKAARFPADKAAAISKDSELVAAILFEVVVRELEDRERIGNNGIVIDMGTRTGLWICHDRLQERPAVDWDKVVAMVTDQLPDGVRVTAVNKYGLCRIHC